MDTDSRRTALLSAVRQAVIVVLGGSRDDAELRRQLDRMDAGTSLKALGVDSMEAVELAAYLEDAFGVPFPENGLAADATVGELIQCLDEGGVT